MKKSKTLWSRSMRIMKMMFNPRKAVLRRDLIMM